MNVKQRLTPQQLARLIALTFVVQAGAAGIAALALWLSMQEDDASMIALARTIIDFLVAWACGNIFMRQTVLRGHLRAEYDRIRGPWKG